MGEVPRFHAVIRTPALVVEWVSALEDLAVDARRSAEDLAARVVDAATVHERLWLRLVLPVVEPAADRERQRRRHVDERVDPPVHAARLQDEHARVRVLGKAIREHRPGGPAPDDDVVELR